MPRPKNLVSEHHFHPIEQSDRKGIAVQCNYCGHIQAGGNPKRCQKHLDDCPRYPGVLAAFDDNILTNPFAHTVTSNSQQSLLQNTHSPGLAATPVGSEKALTITDIKRALHLDESTYNALERTLDSQMEALNVSGPGLHTMTHRTLLRQAFEQVFSLFPALFAGLPDTERTRILSALTQVVNRKRRQANNSLTTPITSFQSAQASSSLTSTFGTTTIISERADGARTFTVCRPSDLSDIDKPAEDITVNDVNFERYILLLNEDDDVMFNSQYDKIVHTFTGGRVKTVSNETVWKVALEEMHRKGSNPIVFSIYKR